MTISKQLRQLRKDVDKVRRFPHNTCPASRHLHIMADCLLTAKKDGTLRYPMFEEEPEHCAESILAVLASLWELRTKHPRGVKEMEREADKLVKRLSK